LTLPNALESFPNEHLKCHLKARALDALASFGFRSSFQSHHLITHCASHQESSNQVGVLLGLVFELREYTMFRLYLIWGWEWTLSAAAADLANVPTHEGAREPNLSLQQQ
jgi:hypothetical protein